MNESELQSKPEQNEPPKPNEEETAVDSPEEKTSNYDSTLDVQEGTEVPLPEQMQNDSSSAKASDNITRVTEEKKKPSVKKILLFSTCIIAIAIIAAVIIVQIIIPSQKIEQGKEALAKGSYVEAANLFVEVNGFGESKELLVQCISAAEEKEDYESAASFCDIIGDTSEANYYRGLIAYNSDNNEEALFLFSESSHDGIEDLIEDCNNRIAMDDAANLWSDGDYLEAKETYLLVPEGYSYKGISANDRISAISKWEGVLSTFKKTLKSTDGHCAVRQTSKRSGSWHSWDGDWQDTATMKLTINSDGSATISGSVSYYVYTSYSSIAAGVHSAEKTRTFSQRVSDGVSFSDGGDVPISFDGETLTLSYDETFTNEDIYFDYNYTSTATYR